jgi:transcriptional regulator with XRE-family HTH domain
MGKGRLSDESTGQRMRRLRQSKGLSQEALGDRVGLSQRMVAYYEIQGGVPSADLLRKLADALGVSTDLLLGRAPESHKAAPPTSNLRLLKRLMRVEELPPHERKVVLKMIDTMANEVRRRKAS